MKIDEAALTYPLDVEVAQLDGESNLKLSAYQTLFARLAEIHMMRFRTDINETLRHDMAWALISIGIEIRRPIRECLTLYGRTWYSARRGPYYRRELEFSDASGAVRFVGSTFSVLLNVADRSVYHGRKPPFPMPEPFGQFTIEADPRFRTAVSYTDIETRLVRPSYIDRLGHVNNCRYGDFAFDALSPDERSRLGQLRRADFYFQSELRPGDRFTVRKASTEPSSIHVSGFNESKGDTSFQIVLKL